MSDSLSPPRYSPLGPLGSTVVIPQQVTDPTILDSVAGFINEVVPAATNGHLDLKSQILWARFEHVDSSQALSFNGENEKPPPIVLTLGYSTGIQVSHRNFTKTFTFFAQIFVSYLGRFKFNAHHWDLGCYRRYEDS